MRSSAMALLERPRGPQGTVKVELELMTDAALSERLGFALVCPGCGRPLIETADGHLRCPAGAFGEDEPVRDDEADVLAYHYHG